ncbi:MAG TPA: peptidoglycan DD-metalloendopeptidase family protein [Gammaproteobacteria bacterium]
MNIIILGKTGRSSRINLASATGVLAILSTFVLLAGASGFLGYRLAEERLAHQPLEEIQAFHAEMDEQRKSVATLREEARENLNALSLRLGQLSAHIIRLDALGDRLTRMAGLDEGEFNFDTPPAQGGPEVGGELENESLPELMNSLDALAMQIDDREQQLTVLENLLMNRNLQDRVVPAGRPITKGWLSSYFGVRTDPFTGKRARHYGLDFAGAMGSDVVAVGAGVVTYSGPRYGYGRMVEINHGNGFVTRYAHAKELLVKVGDVVKKGQVVAHMGSSGRSTGPHVHFEVLRNGKVVNPLQYIRE